MTHPPICERCLAIAEDQDLMGVLAGGEDGLMHLLPYQWISGEMVYGWAAFCGYIPSESLDP